MDNSKILPIDINHEMKTSFIAYSMAVIINRALPDVRDGMKPVHRRILYSMNELNLYPEKPYRKSATVVGDVLGKYHPHGDSSVYDAMVRMAQPFNMRMPLVDGHGNFGSVDGDSAAAMRYTEARLSKIAMEMLRDIDKDTVSFKPNYDESKEEPEVLPARYPNLLVNGTGGIAVGMATNIPPHNLGEVVDATIALIDDPELDSIDLMQYLPGPDFPTGGIICGKIGIKNAYTTGRGKIRVRAKAEIEPMSENRERIIVTEIPYQVNKAQLIEKIADLVHEKRLEGIADLRDESDKSGMRIVIELKRGTNSSVTLNRLYKHTQLQDTFGVIMLALVDGEPKILSLKQIIHHYVDHQRDVIRRRTAFELEKAEKRAHILKGLLIALANIDAVVDLIKKSADANEARQGLCDRFGLTEVQAQAILDMRLQRLTGLEREKLENDYEDLVKLINDLKDILATPKRIDDIIKEDLLKIKEKYSDARKTEITFDEDELLDEDLIEEEDMVVTMTHFGYIKRVSAESYRTQRRGGRGVTGLSTREEDFVERLFVTSTHNMLLYFTNMGKVYMKKCFQIPEASKQAKGTAIVNLLNLDPEEKVTAVLPSDKFDPEANLVCVTKMGVIKKTSMAEYANIRQTGLRAINLREDDELVSVFKTTGNDDIMICSHNGKCIVFSEEDARAIGRTSTGVRGILLKEGDYVIAAEVLDYDKDVLVISENAYGKRTPAKEYRVQARGGQGVRTIKMTEKTGCLAGMLMVDGSEDIMIINDAGIIIRMSSDEISRLGRDTQGVRLMRLGGDDTRVISIEKLAETDEEEEPAPEEA
ncbi:MAG: DNA gyrase subunit A [Christensenellaceae bacterium]|nr:DNA gyrase subunit A [Christensenellaceae bacterium]